MGCGPKPEPDASGYAVRMARGLIRANAGGARQGGNRTAPAGRSPPAQCNAIFKYHIHASDGDIGHVEGLLVDDETWAIRYLIVDTSNWWLGHQVLVAPQWIHDVSWSRSTVSLELPRKALKDAPPYDASLPLDRGRKSSCSSITDARLLAAGRKTRRRTARSPAPVSLPQTPGNRVLADIPAREYRRLQAQLEPVTLNFGQVLYEPGQTIRHVYFPIDCLISLLTAVDKRRTLEVGMVGNEGMAGMPFILGVGVSGVRALVQGRGKALRMASGPFRVEFDRNRPLQEALFRYTYALMAQISQTAACNRFHNTEARLARWLLMTRDRVGVNEFPLTHEFLAHMLGLRRWASRRPRAHSNNAI